jgi:hypothetical protein
VAFSAFVYGLGATYEVDTIYYLVNSSYTPTPGGDPTAAATTPYSINVKEWTQTAAQRQMIYAGGPPFQFGSQPLFVGLGNVTETVEIGIAASDTENAVDLIRLLRRILNSALYATPAVLCWWPDTSVQPTYFDIYSADVQETGEWQNPLTGFTQVLCRVTWTRSAVGAQLSGGPTIINAGSYQNRFSGTPDNQVAYSMAFAPGDTANDGQGEPLNISVTTDLMGANVYMASIYNVTSTSTTQSVTTTSTTGQRVAAGAGNTITLEPALKTIQSLKPRLFVQTTTAAGAIFRMHVLFASFGHPGVGNLDGVLMSTPWMTAQQNATLCDCGTIPIRWLHNTALTTVYVLLEVKSPSGGSVTVTLNNIYLVNYWQMCRLQQSGALFVGTGAASSGGIVLRQFITETDRPALPLPQPRAWTLRSGAQYWPLTIVGTPPRLIYSPASSLLIMSDVNWAGDQGATYTTTRTWTATVERTPLYLTLQTT